MSTSKRYCSVPQCFAYVSKDVSIHFFPLKNKKLCAAWTSVLKIGKPLTKYMTVCSKHFLQTDFMPITAATQRRRLKNGVIPSQNLPIRSHESKRPVGRPHRLERQVPKKHLDQDMLLDQQNDNPCQSSQLDDIYFHAGNSVEHDMDIESEIRKKTYVERGTQTDDSEDTLPKIFDNDEKLKCFTNVDHRLLGTMEKCCNNVLTERSETFSDLRMKIVLVLTKLKLNIPFVCLAILFNISQTKCSRYFYATLPLLAAAVKPTIYWPSKDQILSNMPKCFSAFSNTRVVLDCTEVHVNKCKCLNCRIVTYSHYKGSHTIKFLIGITPSGVISFVSSGHGGRASDKAIFNKERLIEKLDMRDAVMVDKGFLIEHECEDALITLIRPPFLRKNKQFSKTDAETTAMIARARVHVERAIQRIKMYKVLSEQIAWYLVPYIDNIMTVVAALVNLSPPILADDKFIHQYHI